MKPRLPPRLPSGSFRPVGGGPRTALPRHMASRAHPGSGPAILMATRTLLCYYDPRPSVCLLSA